MDSPDNPLPESNQEPDRFHQSPKLVDESDADFLLPGHVEELRGSRPGDARVRIVRPSQPEFRRVSQGVLEATKAAYTPQGNLVKAVSLLKRLLIGVPLATAQAEHERLTKFKALAVLSSDAISSVAYATEAILINLFAVGVFMSFTLSQAGMVLHWRHLRETHKGWKRSMIINGVGALTTLLVAAVISTTKFLEGAWIVVLWYSSPLPACAA